MAPKAPDDPVAGRIGKNVARIRTTDRTQAQIAERMGCASSTISRIENGTYTSLDVQMLVRLALALDCGLDDLLDGCDMAMTIVRDRRRQAA